MSAVNSSPPTRPGAYAGGPGEVLSAPCHFLSRQPIVDAQGRLFGYELFLRPGEADSCDPEMAAREAVDHWLMLAPEQNQGCAFVPSTPTALAEGLVTLLPAENTVLQIDASGKPDPALLHTCLTLRQQGYRFALDAFVPQSDHVPFLGLADFIRVDFKTTDFDDRRAIYAMASGHPRQVLARNVETGIQMRIALSEGCLLFQGNFFSEPVLVDSRPAPKSHLIYIRLLGALHDEPADLRKVEKLVSADASLCYRVLRLANSAMQGHASPVTTVREALLMVGEDVIRKIAIVAVAGALAGDRSVALLSMALSRAHFCELLALSVSEPPARMYLLGIISMLDVLLETPLSRILQTLPISAEMKSALTGGECGPGRVLLLARSLESCDWQRCQETQQSLGLEEGFIASTYVGALRAASAMMREMFIPM